MLDIALPAVTCVDVDLAVATLSESGGCHGAFEARPPLATFEVRGVAILDLLEICVRCACTAASKVEGSRAHSNRITASAPARERAGAP